MLLSPFTVFLIASTLLGAADYKLPLSLSRIIPELPHGMRAFSNRNILDQLPNTTLSDNLLVDSGGLDARAFAFVPAGYILLTGLEPSTGQVIIRRILTNGSTAWQTSFGEASANNVVYALEADASGNSFIAGYLALDFSESQSGSAFVAKHDSTGALAWVVTIGSATSKDTFFGLALSKDNSKVFAVGRAGSSSTIFRNNSSSHNIMRPLLAVIGTGDGAMSTRTPTPLDAGVDEEVRTVVADPQNANYAIAGGMANTQRLSNLVYGLEVQKKNDVQTLEVKTRLKMRSIDAAPVVAVGATTISANGARRFYVVAGCYLYVIDAASGSDTFEIVSSVMFQDQNTCLGTATDVSVRANGDPVVVVRAPSKSVMILQYRAKRSTAGYTNKATSSVGGNSQAKGRVVMGMKTPELMLVAGSNVVAREPRAFLVGVTLSNNTSNETDRSRRLHQAQLIVKIAVLGGTGLVLIVTVVSVCLITRHAKRSGERA